MRVPDSMADDQDLEQFDGVCRLFPLPGVVLFPNAVLPLHIFEPRYRQMTEDALKSDGLVAIVQTKPRPSASGSTSSSNSSLGLVSASAGGCDAFDFCGEPEPETEEFGCIGKIIRHERLPDGRYNLLLQGLSRIRLVDEVESDRLYRLARGQLVSDLGADSCDPAQRLTLLQLFREFTSQRHPQNLNCLAHLESNISLGAVTDFIAHFLNVPTAAKQALLADPMVSRRADQLIDLLGGILRPRRPRWPFKYSDN